MLIQRGERPHGNHQQASKPTWSWSSDCGEAEAGERPALRRAAAGEQAKAIQAAEARKKRE